MRTVADSEVQGLLSELLDCVEQGEIITITRHGVPVGELRPTEAARKQRHARLIEEWRAMSKHITLGPDLTIRQLIDEGKKY